MRQILRSACFLLSSAVVVSCPPKPTRCRDRRAWTNGVGKTNTSGADSDAAASVWPIVERRFSPPPTDMCDVSVLGKLPPRRPGPGGQLEAVVGFTSKTATICASAAGTQCPQAYQSQDQSTSRQATVHLEQPATCRTSGTLVAASERNAHRTVSHTWGTVARTAPTPRDPSWPQDCRQATWTQISSCRKSRTHIQPYDPPFHEATAIGRIWIRCGCPRL